MRIHMHHYLKSLIKSLSSLKKKEFVVPESGVDFSFSWKEFAGRCSLLFPFLLSLALAVLFVVTTAVVCVQARCKCKVKSCGKITLLHRCAGFVGFARRSLQIFCRLPNIFIGLSLSCNCPFKILWFVSMVLGFVVALDLVCRTFCGRCIGDSRRPGVWMVLISDRTGSLVDGFWRCTATNWRVKFLVHEYMLALSPSNSLLIYSVMRVCTNWYELEKLFSLSEHKMIICLLKISVAKMKRESMRR